MKLILVNERRGRCYSLAVGGWARLLLSLCTLGLPCGLAAMVYLHYFSDHGSKLSGESAAAWADALGEQEKQVRQARLDAENKINALGVRVAELQARLMRLDALGERITVTAKLDRGEFDFSSPPGVGGPESELSGQTFAAPHLTDVLDQLSHQIEDRQHQLEMLDNLVANKQLAKDTAITGEPVNLGYVSSTFGRRSDPFSGQVAFHEGMDFAGAAGSDVVAVAAGVVTWSAEKSGYGNMVEVNHGNGFKTRYGHCQENLVKIGDVVKKGQVIALLGTSGHSTGPHVHFEVYKNGRVVDPASYIRTTVP